MRHKEDRILSLSAYDTLEVVYVHRPLGVTLGERALRGLTVKCRDGREEELDSLGDNINKLRLYVLTPQQYAPRRIAIQRLMEKSAGGDAVGFLLVEDPGNLATVRERKRIHSAMNSPWIVGDLRAPFTFNQVLGEINKATHHLFLNANEDLFSSMVAIREIESRAINEIGQAMTSQSSIDELMRLILEKAIELSTADSGFLILRDNMFGQPAATTENTVKLLRSSSHRFILKARICKSQNIRVKPDLLDPQKSPFTSMVVNRASGLSWIEGMEGPTARRSAFGNGEVPLVKPELEFDDRTYALKSYCCFPLRTPSEEVVGFILLLNRRVTPGVFLDGIPDIERYVGEFDSHDLNILEALANQAGVSIDHTRLIGDLKTVFESFVEASVVAIESRDPTTKGHSERVATLTCGLAEAVNRSGSGPYANISFNNSQLYELKYAALLHDFGKIGVREDVLRKEKKLYSHELNSIRQRFQMLEKQLHLKCLESYLEGLMAKGEPPSADGMQRIRREVDKITTDLREFWSAIVEANEPHVVNSGNFQKITEIAAVRVTLGEEQVELLSPEEMQRLSIRKGSLAPEERLEIESHVTHSYRFLINIPWTSDLSNVPDIVYGHHERLDGSGYPRKLVEDEIPIQAKIMAIADIYDALVAMDRPYKKAIPLDRALSILEAEVKEGKLDGELFRIFVESRVCDLIRAGEPKVA
jgi:HD-GYP domain-containing protein (c-di-GMP phosphodiesterase class II)